ncbi:MAG: hypothetical protein ACXVGQ_14775, partial [Mycobacteriaceae bacterium]
VINRKGWSRMNEPMLEGKSHVIPKQVVWDAWLKVKENGGAAGVDGVTIGQFEERVKDNLYKLWLCRVGDYAEWAALGDRSARWRPRAALIGSA